MTALLQTLRIYIRVTVFAKRCQLVRNISEFFVLGCTTAEHCASRSDCVTDDEQTCLKYGCCNTSLCVANYTYFYTTPSPSPTPTPAEIRASTPVQIPTSAPAEIPTSAPAQILTSAPAQIPTSAPAPAPATTQISPVEKLSTPVVQASPTKKPAVAATSSVPEKVSSEPAMATSKAAKPMMSSQKQVEPTESKEVMTSSVGKMKPTPSQIAGNTAEVHSLVENRSTVDNRPTCPDSSERVYSLSLFALVAIAILCNVF